jgi:hypothetical protein
MLGRLTPVAILAAVVLSACGSSSPGGSNASNPADNAFKFSRCMREHGVKDFPNPQIEGRAVRFTLKNPLGKGGVNRETLTKAQNACKRYQAFEQRKLSPQEKVEHEEQVRKFARCMREHGIDVHASTSADGGFQVRIGGPNSAAPNPESPAFQSGQKACQKILPFKRGPGGGPSTGATGGKGGAGDLSIGG